MNFYGAAAYQFTSALCEYQVSPIPLENALRSDQLQCQPVSVAAGFAADRLAHHLHVEEIRRAETRAQLRRYRAGDIACRRQPGPDRAHGEKPPLLARVNANTDFCQQGGGFAGFFPNGQARIEVECEVGVNRYTR